MLARLLFLLAPLAFSAAGQNEDFFAAARRGDAKAVEELLAKGVSVEAKWRYDQTALFPACDRGHVAVVKVLLAHGANVNVEDTFYHATPLNWAINNDHPEVVKLLVEKNAKGKDQALSYAVGKNHPEIVRAVLDAGRVPDKTLTSALRRANRAKRTEVAEMLTKAGAVVPPDFPVDAEVLASYAGYYKPVVSGPPDLSFFVNDGKLVGGVPGRPDPLTLFATDKTAFSTEENDQISFTFKVEGGKVTGLILQQGSTPINYTKVEAK